MFIISAVILEIIFFENCYKKSIFYLALGNINEDYKADQVTFLNFSTFP